MLVHLQVAELDVPYVLMHMRGTPQTMLAPHHTAYGDICREVAVELQAAGGRASRSPPHIQPQAPRECFPII